MRNIGICLALAVMLSSCCGAPSGRFESFKPCDRGSNYCGTVDRISQESGVSYYTDEYGDPLPRDYHPALPE